VDGPRPGRGRRRRLEQQRRDHLRAQLEHEGEERLVGAGLRDVPDHRQLDRHDEELARAVGEGAAVQRRLLHALCDDRQRRLEDVTQRLGGRRRAHDRDARQRRARQALAGMAGDQLPQAGQLVHAASQPRGRPIGERLAGSCKSR
jgi:hypothetical protein